MSSVMMLIGTIGIPVFIFKLLSDFQKDESMSKGALGIITSIVIIGIGVSMTDIPSDTENTENKEIEVSSEYVEETQEFEIDKKSIIKKAKKAVRDKKAEVIVSDDGRNVIIETYNNTGFKSMYWLGSAEAFESLFKSAAEVSDITIIWTASFSDPKGNESIGPYIRVNMTRDTADRIHWDRFNTDDMPNTADRYEEHHSIK